MTMKPFNRIHIDPNAYLPIFAQLREQITWLIASGEIKPGEHLPPIRALAAQLGIHMHTVRLAYHHLEEDGFVNTRPGRGTVVLPGYENIWIKRGAEFPSFTIGVTLPSLNPFYAPYLAGIEAVSRQSAHLPIIVYTHDDPILTRQGIQQLVNKNIDGLIVTAPVIKALPDELKMLSQFPIVYVDAPQMTENSILIDAEGAGYLSTSHLISHGHRQVGMITGPVMLQNIFACFRGYERALRHAGLEVNEALICEVPEFTVNSGFHGAMKLLDQPSFPRAIFAAADILAIGAMRAVKFHGLRIPQDVAIAGFNNIELSALVEPALTTVSAPMYRMGIEAMSMLVRLQRREKLPRQSILLQTELVIRQSCGCRE